jgi:hypothetical protein
MNFEQKISFYMKRHSLEWFEAMRREFIALENYNKETDTVEYRSEMEISQTFTENDPISSTKLVYTPTDDVVEAKYSDYCWGRIDEKYRSKYFSLGETLEEIFKAIDEAVTLTHDLDLKLKVIETARNVLRDEISNICKSGGVKYKYILTPLSRALWGYVKSNYSNIYWIVDQDTKDPEGQKDSSTTLKPEHPAIDRIPKHLRKSFFLDLLNLELPLHKGGRLVKTLPPEEFKKLQESLYYLYNKGQYTSDIEIDFMWSKTAVYCILGLLVKYSKKLTYEKLAECKFIKIDGKPLSSPGAIRKGFHKSSKLDIEEKSLIVDLFTGEVER